MFQIFIGNLCHCSTSHRDDIVSNLKFPIIISVLIFKARKHTIVTYNTSNTRHYCPRSQEHCFVEKGTYCSFIF
ncbi:ORF1158 [White spot syndrome virus]|uniref:ORF1158 n=1 Tax=White spot syndrome virus TaxID=342409 RepID=A0A2D3I6C5_9VIRU|nr:ORF1158 [White spot syndrome virus]